MQRSQFGQRGAAINGEPVSQRARSAPAAPRTSADTDEERTPPVRVFVLLFIALVSLFWLEALVSGTSLITPINQTLLWGMRGAGLIIGFVVSLVAVLIMTDAALWRRGLTLLFCPFLIAFGFGEMAYRIADWAAFGFSNQQFESAQYPIKSISHGRKGARSTIQIDPFDTGDTTNIPVTADQYHVLVKSSADSCVTVMQRKSKSGAIEIATNGRYMWSTPEQVPVARCGFAPGEAAPTIKGADNPWSKD